MTFKEDTEAGSNPGLGLYIAAVGAAALTAFADGVRNGNASALRKTGIALREMVESGDLNSAYLSLLALGIFCLIAALMVYVYRPRARREAFTLGLGVLAAMGLAVAPPPPTELRAGTQPPPLPLATERPAHQSLGDVLGNLLPSAHAQPQPGPTESRRATVWVFLDGPSQLRMPETHVLVYSLRGKAVLVNAPASIAFQIALPPGDYQFEVSHAGYRSVAFPVTVEAQTQALQVPMEPVNMDLQNFFGPARTKIRTRPDLARQLDTAMSLCTSTGGERNPAARAALPGIDRRWLKALAAESRRMLCA